MRCLSKFIMAVLFAVSLSAYAIASDITGGTYYLLEGVTVPTLSATSPHVTSPIKTIQASLTGVGAVTAHVVVTATNIRLDTGKWVTLFETDLSGTTTASFGMVVNAPWMYYRAEVTTITGTSSACSVILGT